jgi:amidophosphoribosyltransferase
MRDIRHLGFRPSGRIRVPGAAQPPAPGAGELRDSLRNRIISELNGRGAIGHVRYSTLGASSLQNAQPLVADTQNGPVAIAHNGQFANCDRLRASLRSEGCIFKTDSDTEIILHFFARTRSDSIEEILRQCFREVRPSYSIVLITRNELAAIRDPSGNRPLVLGAVDGAFLAASETVAFDILRAQYLGEVKPGELVIMDEKGMRRRQLSAPQEELRCIFEYVYFARPDSFLFGASLTTGEVRKEFGRTLIPVPDSSTDAALGFSQESGIPFDYGLIRSHYVGRTFIEPTQAIRDAKVRKKYNPNRSVLKDKRVVVVEDSIVRGTTLRNLINILREFGAAEVHVRVSSSPYRYSCYLGIDTAETSHLIASRLSVEEIRGFLGADSLGYLSLSGMTGNRLLSGGFCTYCFDGRERISRA